MHINQNVKRNSAANFFNISPNSKHEIKNNLIVSAEL